MTNQTLSLLVAPGPDLAEQAIPQLRMRGYASEILLLEWLSASGLEIDDGDAARPTPASHRRSASVGEALTGLPEPLREPDPVVADGLRLISDNAL